MEAQRLSQKHIFGFASSKQFLMDLLCRPPWPQDISTVMTMFTNIRSQKVITFQAGVKTLPAKLNPPDPETPKT